MCIRDRATDARRGAGTYAAVVRAMDVLRRHRLPFGVSCCYTHANAASIGSEAFVDDLVARGAKFAWFFTYMPVGASAPTDLLATAEDRAFMYRQIRAFRETKPLFTMDSVSYTHLVHETNGYKVVVTIEAETLDDSHDIASTFIALEGVIGINLVYANFEDDPTVQKAAVR